MISTIKVFTGISIAIFMSSCATSIEGIRDTNQLVQNDSIGYAAFNFQNNTGWECFATIQDTVTKKSYSISLDKPEQQTNTITLFGATVYQKRVGDSVKIRNTIIPFSPSVYKVKYINLRAGRESYSGFGSEKIFTVKPKSITYLGKIQTDIFILIFPWKFSLKAEDNSSYDLQEFSKSIEVLKQITDLK